MQTTALDCKKCGRLFSNPTRLPVIMPCCYSSICLECWDKSFRPDYRCSLQCGNDAKVVSKKPIINEQLSLLVQSMNSVRILCSAHSDEPIFGYSTREKKLVCQKCQADEHIKVSEPMIQTCFKRLVSCLQER